MFSQLFLGGDDGDLSPSARGGGEIVSQRRNFAEFIITSSPAGVS